MCLHKSFKIHVVVFNYFSRRFLGTHRRVVKKPVTFDFKYFTDQSYYHPVKFYEGSLVLVSIKCVFNDFISFKGIIYKYNFNSTMHLYLRFNSNAKASFVCMYARTYSTYIYVCINYIQKAFFATKVYMYSVVFGYTYIYTHIPIGTNKCLQSLGNSCKCATFQFGVEVQIL